MEQGRSSGNRVQSWPGSGREDLRMRLCIQHTNWASRPARKHSEASAIRQVAGNMLLAFLLASTGIAMGQDAIPATPPAPMSVPSGYSIHQAVDVGGRLNYTVGSEAMYDSLLNVHTGPRVLTETFEMQPLPGKNGGPIDNLSAFGSGFGGDPVSVARMDFSKGKVYEFSALFRRDRKYFDYDLLGNPNTPSGQSIPIGPSNAPTGSFAWPQTVQSPFLFNTVRRMTDTNLTLRPLSAVTYRVAYSKSVMEGPSYSPSGYQFAKYNAVLEEHQRNSTDDLTADVDWKPVQGTKVTYEEQVTHYKGDSFFTLNPNALTLQEADGTRVAINDFDSLTPYGISACNTGSMGSAYTSPLINTILTASTNGGPPVINPACAVVTNYLRSQPTRVLFPTEVLRLQTSSIKNLSMNANVRFTDANMNLPNYYDSYQGLNGATRSLTYQANASVRREDLAADYGALWQATDRFSLSEQINYSSFHQPGTITFTSVTTSATPANPNETINYPTLTSTNAAPGASTFEGSPAVGVPGAGYTGQLYLTNNVTASWDASSRVSLAFTYRYQNHQVAEGDPHNTPLAVGAVTGGTVTIDENAGVLNITTRPASNWELNGSVEAGYSDNALTPVSPRQLRHYRMHTIYKPRPWATLSGVYNDLERHNNTNNNQSAVAAGDDPYEGPLDHVDHSRIASVNGSLMPGEHYAFDFSYVYSDVYTATNICFDNGDQNPSTTPGVFPGAATLTSSGTPNVCPGVYTRGSTTQLADWFGRDFMDAPTQFGSGAISISPGSKTHFDIGYRISSVNGSQFFNDARAVNGSLVSTYQSPYFDAAYKVRAGLTLKTTYNFYGYGEGGPSGSEYCSFSTSLTSSVVPCNSLAAQTGQTISSAGETAPRNFHANNLLLGVHYEF